MKTSPLFYILITTFLLLTITIMSSLNVAFNWVFYLTVIGQLFIILMVYRVLTDNYTTDKAFEDFYEDNPIQKRNESLEKSKKVNFR